MAATAALAVLVILSGCGSDEAPGAGEAPPRPAEGGTLEVALASDPAELDPLLASERSARLVTRQIHEPLVATLSGPFGDAREVPGLAELIRPSRDRTIWRLRLRGDVSFQDGTPFNAAAVLANAERWRTLEAGRALLPRLVAVDAPRPNLVRFILDRPDPRLDERLSDVRLGIVSPRALRPRSGVAAQLARREASGTGPFELRERDPRAATVLARNVEWWGSELDLGPALDQVAFSVVADESQRLALLASGDVDVADALSRGAVASLRRDPLLTHAGGALPPFIGFERSVRGLGGGSDVPVLSGVWLTTVGAAG